MGFKPRVPRTFRSVVVNENENNTPWANPDILPVPYEERTYDWKGYFGYWFTIGMTTTVWALSSSHLAAGLDAASAIGGILVGSVLASTVAVFCGEPGVSLVGQVRLIMLGETDTALGKILYHLGFPMMSRATFGMYGSFFVIIVKCFVNIILSSFGIQSYWGGQAASVVLGALSPSFLNMPNTLPESAGIDTQRLIGFIIFIVIFTSLMFIHPTKLQPLLFLSQILIGFTILGLFIWAMASNSGATILPPSTELSSSDRSFRILLAMSSVAGSWTGSAIRQSDWTRYTRSRHSVVWQQMITGPISTVICATMGVAVTSAVTEMYGQAIWNPITLLSFLQHNNYNAATRAGTFFAGIGFFMSQMSVNLVQNSVSCGMDLASLWPKYIDITRGSLIMCLIGYLIQPWRFVEQPGMFISVLSAFGMFVSPLAGINCVDFWVVRKRKWRVPDLYNGNTESIYWYTFGWNWRAMLSWGLVIWPSFPGFIANVTETADSIAVGWLRCFQVSWITGFCGGAVAYYFITLICPPPGGKPYEKLLLEEESNTTIEATQLSNTGEDVSKLENKFADNDNRIV
ncbi:hypothetical protein S40288_08095 [Stachybotrys chartarum IBT 40288]|nr:hypothetical protein S40288_08095 [Stachybotrys chartarum IBT 40288]